MTDAEKEDRRKLSSFGRRYACGLQKEHQHRWQHCCEEKMCYPQNYCGRTTSIKSIFDDPLHGEQSRRVKFEGWILDGPNTVRMQPFVVRLPPPTLARKIDVWPPTIRRIPFFDMSAPWLQLYREDRQSVHSRFVSSTKLCSQTCVDIKSGLQHSYQH